MIKKIATILSVGLLISSMFTQDIYAKEDYKKEHIKGTGKEISMELNKSTFEKADEIVLINEKSLVDAISVTPFAYAKNAPIVTTEWKDIDKETKEYIEELGVKKITIIGGIAAISKTSEYELEDMGIEVERIYGKDRSNTSMKIARKMYEIKPFSEAIILSRNADMKNAISIYSYAAKNNIPIIWGEDNNLDRIGRYLEAIKVKKVYAIGNSLEFEEELEKSVKNYEHIETVKRTNSNIDIINEFYGNIQDDTMYVINGELAKYLNEADYVSLGVVAAKQNIPILVAGDILTEEQEEYLKSNNIKDIIEVGYEVDEYDIMEIVTSKDFISRVMLILLLLIISIRILILK